MAFTLADAVVYFKGDDSHLDGSLKKSERAMGGWAGNAAKFVGGAVVGAAAIGGAALVGMAVEGTKAFIGFENSMNEVFTLLPGISQSAMDDMNDQVKQFSRDFGVLPEDVIPALYQALSAGVPPDNVFDFLATSQQAAVGGVAELATAVDGISSVVNAYGADVMDATKASDLMFTAVKLGKTDFGQLSASLFQVIPTAAALGVEFGDVTAALAAMTAQGTPTSVATTQLRQLFVELSSAGSKASKEFEKMAGQSFVDFVASGGNVQDALILMEQAAENNGVRLSDMFGSVEAGNAALALTGKGADVFRANLEEMGQASGATEAAFTQMDSGIGKSIEKIRAAWAVTVLDLGTKVAPAFALLVETVLEWMPKISEVTSQVFDAVGATVQWTLNFVQDVFGRFKTSADSDLVAPLSYWQEWVATNLPLVQTLFENVLSAIQGFWELFGEDILHVVSNTFEAAWTVIDTVMKTIGDVITLALQLLTGDWEGAWDTFLGIFERIWDTIVTVVGLKLDNLRTLFTAIDWAGAGRGIVNGVKDGINAAWDGLVNWFRSKVEALRNMFPFSEPKDPQSPLRGLGKAGEATVEMYKDGMESALGGLRGTLSGGLAGMLGGPSTALAGAGGRGVNVTINISGLDDPNAVGRASQRGVLAALRQAGVR